ncbi:hypothetical protein [Plantactinospora sp. WMMB782]|uniref:hypothetical protein n=1 Tax=Plantactinospora sp. WMMB782 TaxID=3404121 RepID=UPI003B952717
MLGLVGKRGDHLVRADLPAAAVDPGERLDRVLQVAAEEPDNRNLVRLDPLGDLLGLVDQGPVWSSVSAKTSGASSTRSGVPLRPLGRASARVSA